MNTTGRAGEIMDGSGTSIDLAIQGMTCASCVRRVERALARVPGVTAVAVNLASERARVTGAARLDALAASVHNAGYEAHPLATAAPPTAQRDLRAVAIAAALAAPLAPGMLAGPRLMLPGAVQCLLAALVLAGPGARFFRGAYHALRQRTATMDVLVALGATTAFGLSLSDLSGAGHGLYFDSAAWLVTFVLVGKALEARARRQAAGAIGALVALRPETARVRRDGAETEIPLARLQVGDLVLARPGERLAADGIVTQGTAAIDQSMLTGESLPRVATVGDTVSAGTIPLDGALVIQAAAVGGETALARIIRLVETAQASKSPVEHLVDRVSAVFVPVVLLLALATLAAWLAAGASTATAILSAVSVLVIACPCAMGLATPAAVMAGTGVAARRGILIRDAAVLDHARAIRTVVFDKTGTLTAGQPVLAALHTAPGVTRAEALRLAAALLRASEHPLARAVLAAATETAPDTTTESTAATAFRVLPGRGVTGTVDGRELSLGSARLLQEQDVANNLEGDVAGTVSYLLAGREVLARLVFTDQLRPGAAAAIARLQNTGLRCVLLTGDSQAAADAVARATGIDQIFAGVLPDAKAATIARLRAAGGKVAMVGDGINDAPALAEADLAIAMHGGTDVAVQTAGIALLRADPMLVADALDIARRTHAKIRQGLAWAFAYNLAAIPLAACGVLTPAMAGAAMALSSVSVVANALLLRRWHGTAAGKLPRHHELT